jgi:hypothetical protein
MENKSKTLKKLSSQFFEDLAIKVEVVGHSFFHQF